MLDRIIEKETEVKEWNSLGFDENARSVEKRILSACQRSGRTRSEVTVVAVSKYSSVEETSHFIQNGYTHLGENRLQSAAPKLAVYNEVTWHFIGHLQSRKVRDVLPNFSYIHSIDSEALAEEVVHRSQLLGVLPKCFLQINISQEESKSGFSSEALKNFVSSPLFLKLRPIGLMTMTPKMATPKVCRSVYQGLRNLRDEVRNRFLHEDLLSELSMGMSQDFEIAIEEGATFVRLGSVFLE